MSGVPGLLWVNKRKASEAEEVPGRGHSVGKGLAAGMGQIQAPICHITGHLAELDDDEVYSHFSDEKMEAAQQ